MADGTQNQVPDETEVEAPRASGPDAGATETSVADPGAEPVGAGTPSAQAVDAQEPAAGHVEGDSTAETVPAEAAPGPRADTGRVARIVAALRQAHADQAARTAAAAAESSETAALSDTAESSETAEPAHLPAPRRASSGVRHAPPAMPTLRWNPGARYRASQLANQAVRPEPNVALPPVPPPPVPPPPAPLPPVPAPPAGAPPALAGRLFRGPARRTAVFEREIWYPTAPSSRIPSDVGEALAAAVERYRKGSISTSGLVRAIASTHAA